MALTYELADPQSQVFKYLLARCPIIDGTKRGAPLANELQRVLGFATFPKMRVVESPVAHDSVRYYLGDFNTRETVAARGARLLHGAPPGKEALRLSKSFFEQHEKVLSRLQPVKKRLTQGDEDVLARDCIVMA